jgi:hypothetical protein
MTWWWLVKEALTNGRKRATHQQLSKWLVPSFETCFVVYFIMVSNQSQQQSSAAATLPRLFELKSYSNKNISAHGPRRD